MSSPIALDYSEQERWLRQSAARNAERDRRLAAEFAVAGYDRAADIGCGAGGMAAALKSARPGAAVLAVDSDAAVLDIARSYAAEHGADLDFRTADLDAGAEAIRDALGGPVDLVWAGHVVHHAVDQQAALDALAANLRPGGRMAVAEGGLGARILPWDIGFGRPGLHARLETAGSLRMEAENAERGAVPMPYGWTRALRLAGLRDIETRTEFIDRPAPLAGGDLTEALDSLAARVEWFGDFLDGEDRDVWQALLDPADSHWLGNRDDLHHWEIRTVYTGRRA
ncbi:methyltransferase [Glycomyces terrestris]|uniref:methyltransferase n=1 Tax=Glycomyces terrestris TaxID=2493553 RepID=UPI0013151F28|nr:methyltransferase [Glycomyces terrestris]